MFNSDPLDALMALYKKADEGEFLISVFWSQNDTNATVVGD